MPNMQYYLQLHASSLLLPILRDDVVVWRRCIKVRGALDVCDGLGSEREQG